MEDARRQLQSHIAVDVMIEGLDQRLTDSITYEGCTSNAHARLPPTLGGVYSAAMIACHERPVSCEKQSPEGALSVALVFCFRIPSYYAAHQVLAMFNRRFDSRPIAERPWVWYVSIPNKRSVAPAAAAAQSVTDASSSQAPPTHYDAQSQLSSSSAAFRPLIPIPSPRPSTPDSASVVFAAPFSGAAHLSFVSPTGAHLPSDSTHSRIALPASSLFALPAFYVTITPTATADTNPAPTTISSSIAQPSVALAASVATLSTASTSVLVPSAAPVVPSTTQSTVLTVTPVTADPSAKASSTSVVSSVSSSTSAALRRRKAEPHSRGTQPKRAAREDSTAVAPIVLDSSGETHATDQTTANTPAASTTVSSIPNLLTAAQNELMRFRAAQFAKFAYAGSRFPTPPSNPRRITDSPATAENSAASSPKSEGPTRAPTPHLQSEILPLPESASTPAPPPSSSSSRPRSPDYASIPDSSAFATTDNAPIDSGRKLECRSSRRRRLSRSVAGTHRVYSGRRLRLVSRRRNCRLSRLHRAT